MVIASRFKLRRDDIELLDSLSFECKEPTTGEHQDYDLDVSVFGEFCGLYLDELQRRGCSTSYIKRSNSTLNRWVSFLMVGANKQDWLDFTARLFERGLSKTTVASNQSVIRNLYRFLVSEDIKTTNPFEFMSSPKLDKRLPQTLTVEEVKTLIKAPDLTTPEGKRDRAIMELLYATGIRSNELVNLDLSHVNIDSQEALVFGKGAKERIVLFGVPAKRALISYLREARPQLLNDLSNNAFFIGSRGKRISGFKLGKMVGLYGKVALGKRVWPHLLRHCFATHMLNGGANLRVIQELLGHSSIATTEIYTHVSMAHIRDSYMKAFPLAQRRVENET